MSNKQVPAVYRSVINQTISGARPDFEEAGVEDAVLGQLQRKWEEKLAQTRVADFKHDQRMAEHARHADAMHAQRRGGGSSGQNGSEYEDDKRHLSKDAALAKQKENPDALDSDLDESDEEEKAEEAGDSVIALYEKVTRVKNKWKVSLKDGVIKVSDKEYLFQKCQGEFEW